MERILRHKEEDLLFKGKNIHCRKKPLFEGWGDSLVYSGYFKKPEDSKEEEIVVRKIKVTDCFDKWEDIAKKHTRKEDPIIKHDNVLKIISYEGTETDEWRFFALERYDATLEQFCKGIYKGPMPSDAQVLCQITEGLLYLHKVRCPHGNLTPRTILIASSQPVRMMIKLSEFGLSKFGAQCDEEMGKPQDLCLKKYWRLLDGNTDNNQQTPTPNQDIFAAGCLCFYFLKRGVHPFGDDSSSILENIKKRNPVNLLKTLQQYKGVWEFAYEPIKNMIGDPPTDGTNWLMIAAEEFMKALSLKVDEKNELGKGGYGVVYEGTFNGNPVAVKELKRSDYAIKKEQEREMEEHFRLDHENVLKLLHVDDSSDKTYLLLELCAGTLTNYWEKKYNELMPPNGIVLYQIANGLHYIHSRNLVHRDVKPDNILISMTTPVQIKLSDFGFVKKTSPQGTFSLSGVKGTEKWMAPEILEHWMNNTSPNDLPHGTIQSDTFAAGCVFFYFLTRGRHPFVEPIRTHHSSEHPEIRKNVLNNKPKALDIELKKNFQGDDDRALYELIGKMIKPKEERISLPEVIEQLTTNLTASLQFKRVDRLVLYNRKCVVRFHPKKPVLACGILDEIIFFSAENWSIPFSNWKEDENKFQSGHVKVRTMEWNADGTQLAAISPEEVIVCWSCPSGEILFKKKLDDEKMNRIKWNPFRPNVFATFQGFLWYLGGKVFFFNSCPDDQRPFHFCTIKCEVEILSFQWISANRVALGLRGDRRIEIWEIDESTTCAQIVKRLELESDYITNVAWDERTKCLAVCSLSGWMTIWSMDSDQPIHATKIDGFCCRLAWRPNGKQMDDEGVDAARKSADNFILAGGLFNGKIVVWTPLDLKEKTRILISQHSSDIDSLSFSPDGRFFASADHLGKFIIWATENWEPVYRAVYIGIEQIWGVRLSWMSSSSTYVPDYKLTCDSYDGKVHVIEYAVGQNEKPSEDKSDMSERIAKEKETRGEWSIGSSSNPDLT